jgi:hypothetical protein
MLRRTARQDLWFFGGVLLLGLFAGTEFEQPAFAQAKKKGPVTKKVAPPAPPESFLRSDLWKGVPADPLKPGEIDELLAKEAVKVQSSPRTTDEQFLRRIHLDLTGKLPTAAEIEAFRSDTDVNKRSKWIEKLQASDAYARHWARYWRHVVMQVEAPFGDAHVPAYEDWLTEQLKSNKNWGEIVRSQITADGQLKRSDKTGNNPAIFFLARHNAADADNERAAETSRIFLGIQLQCAQCHNDRRTRIWKQVQFHELAGFYARVQTGGSFGDLMKISAKKNGEHKMPGKEKNEEFITYPRFLDGQANEKASEDAERRKALADYLTSPENYWFSAAFVNRVWTELLGQGFYERVDDLSPKSEIVFQGTLVRLASAFRGSGYDTKALIRAIVSSDTYQRQVRLGEALNQHLKFASVYPVRLRGDVMWSQLDCTLGRMPENPQTTKTFKAEFDFDPSLKADEVQLSVAQALWLLNNPIIAERVKVQMLSVSQPNKNGKGFAPGPNEPTYLKKLLASRAEDDVGAIKELYLHTLARRPTDREIEICVGYIQTTKAESGTRNEAFEDLLKGLINTAEFQRRR